MKLLKILFSWIFLTLVSGEVNAQQSINKSQTRDGKQQSIITISALTAKGDLVQLQKVLHVGLDSGLTVNQIKEVLVHLYAYCGFPRSIRGLQTFMAVLDERKAKGINDVQGAAPSPINNETNKYERGSRRKK